MCGKPEAWAHTEALEQVRGRFHRKTGGLFQAAVCAVPWRWQPSNNSFSNSFRPQPQEPGSQGTSPVRIPYAIFTCLALEGQECFPASFWKSLDIAFALVAFLFLGYIFLPFLAFYLVLLTHLPYPDLLQNHTIK